MFGSFKFELRITRCQLWRCKQSVAKMQMTLPFPTVGFEKMEVMCNALATKRIKNPVSIFKKMFVSNCSKRDFQIATGFKITYGYTNIENWFGSNAGDSRATDMLNINCSAAKNLDKTKPLHNKAIRPFTTNDHKA